MRSPLGADQGRAFASATMLARDLASPIDVLVAANPCMGLDFGAVAEAPHAAREVARP